MNEFLKWAFDEAPAYVIAASTVLAVFSIIAWLGVLAWLIVMVELAWLFVAAFGPPVALIAVGWRNRGESK